MIESHKLEPRYATIRKGEVLLWSANLLHGGFPHRDKARTRHSQVTHFFFEDCEYYTPLLTDDEHVEWSEPTWITSDYVVPPSMRA